MISWNKWRRMPISYWQGKKVKTLVPLENGNITIPEGTILEICGKYNGVELRGLEVCPHCKIGLKITISWVPPLTYHCTYYEKLYPKRDSMRILLYRQRLQGSRIYLYIIFITSGMILF